MAGIIGAVAGGAAIALVAMQGTTAPIGARDKAAIEAIVREYILAHPEIIPEAIDKLQGRRTAELINANRKALETPFAGGWAGARDGDVVLVEFFDYSCGYCRQSVADVDRLIKEDPKLKVVFRELPILGDASDAAAKVSLSAARQGAFYPFHLKLYAAGRPTPATIARVQKEVGLDPAKVAADDKAADIQAEIEANIEMARGLQLSGTPAFVVGNQLLPGAVGYDALKKAIAEARAAKR
ncbi:outer membrane protein [Sphingomonas sp. DBB INV C78]|uniref:DsbA family protein n=1 Tax=Sphingomonas sp. DBB INV C78 TaxID=3349434 RepID=UPI0036D26033